MIPPFFFGSLACLCLAILSGRFPRLWLALVLSGAGCALISAAQVLGDAGNWAWEASFTLGCQTPQFLVDGISALFLVPVSVIGGLSAVYSREYWSDHHHPDSAPRGRSWSAALILGMILVLSLANGLHFLLAWEIFAISAYFLITLDNTAPETRKAGWLYLAASHAGTMILFAFFSAVAARTGSWALGPMRDQAALAPLFWLALCGFGVKAGLFPLHVWLPSAHANAPSHVSALMSAVAIKMGVYGIVRFSAWLPLPPGAGWVVLGLGAMSALLGIAFAMAQNDFKRLLAYCSVENIGIILTGLGLAISKRLAEMLGGDIAVACLPDLAVPLAVVRGYEPPAWVGPRTLLLGVSHSGGTEETLGCVRTAARRGCVPVCVTMGGELAATTARHGWPLLRVPGGLMPRAALGFLTTAVLAVLERLPVELADQVVAASAESEDTVRLTLADGALVEWGSADQSALKARVLLALRASPASAGASVFDVSAPTLPITRT